MGERASAMYKFEARVVDDAFLLGEHNVAKGRRDGIPRREILRTKIVTQFPR